MIRFVWLSLLMLMVTGGCRQPFGTTAQAPAWGGSPTQANVPGGSLYAGNGQYAPGAQSAAQMNQLAQQIQSLNTQLGQFNSDNENLHTQIAALQQRLQNANNYNDQLRTQLADTLTRLQQHQQLASNPAPSPTTTRPRSRSS